MQTQTPGHLFDNIFVGTKEMTFAKGQTVIAYGQSGGLYYVKSGYVKRYTIDKQGTLSVQSVYGPGSFFPLTPVFIAFFDIHISQNMSDYVYEAMSEAVVQRTDIIRLLSTDIEERAEIYRALLYESGHRLESNVQQLENLALKDAYRRVAHQLAFLARHHGEVHPQGIILKIPVTQQDVADMLSMTRETVTRQYARLKRNGLIAMDRHLVITNLPGLQAAYA